MWTRFAHVDPHLLSQACMNLFYPYNRGALYTALIVLYSLTAGIAGYVASSYYKQVRRE